MARPKKTSLSECCRSYFVECHKLYSSRTLFVDIITTGVDLAILRQRKQDVLGAYFRYLQYLETAARRDQIEKKPVSNPHASTRVRRFEAERVSDRSEKDDNEGNRNGGDDFLLGKTSPKRNFNVKPNHFICLRISNPTIHKALASVQERIYRKCPPVKSAFSSVSLLHLTLMVINLEDDQIGKAIEALEEVKDVLRTSLGKAFTAPKLPSFSVKGLGSFDGQVLFAHVDRGRDLVVEIGKVVRIIYESQGMGNTDDRPVNPHATLLKLFSSPKLRYIGIKKLQPDWYANDQNSFFGEQEIDGLQLCSMDKWRDPQTNFYRIVHSIDLFPRP